FFTAAGRGARRLWRRGGVRYRRIPDRTLFRSARIRPAVRRASWLEHRGLCSRPVAVRVHAEHHRKLQRHAALFSRLLPRWPAVAAYIGANTALCRVAHADPSLTHNKNGADHAYLDLYRTQRHATSG